MKTIPIFCLGPSGSYGSEAAKLAVSILEAQMPHLNFEIRHSVSNTAIFEDAKVNGGVAVVPVENGYEGPVSEVMRYRLQNPDYPMSVIGEVVVPIEHHILMRPGYSLDLVRGVASHPQALGQCSKFIRQHRLTTFESKSTALAAQQVAENTLSSANIAAIASKSAGELFGLVSLGLAGDVKDNKTRFHVYAPWKTKFTGKDRTAFLFGIPDVPGSQCDVLEIFKRHNVNLSTNDSVRTGKLGKVEFYLVADMHQDSEVGKAVIKELHAKTQNLRILGSFAQAKSETVPVSKLESKKIGIVGGAGSMGKLFTLFFELRGMEVITCDVDTVTKPMDVALNSDIIFLAIPITKVESVLREMIPYLRPTQTVISLASRMIDLPEWSMIPSRAFMHFMQAPRGLDFGKRYVHVSASESLKVSGVYQWLQIMAGEFDAVFNEVTVNRHEKDRIDQVLVVSIVMLWIKVIKDFNLDPSNLIQGGSPVTDVIWSLFAKVGKQSEMYGAILGEHASIKDIFRCIAINAEQFGYVIGEFGSRRATDIINELASLIDTKQRLYLVQRAERMLSLPNTDS